MIDPQADRERLSHAELLQLKRWNTPTIYNGWEQITRRDRIEGGFNREETVDFMPQMGPMVGYAITLVIQPGEARHPRDAERAPGVLGVVGRPGPKIVVVQDLDKPRTIGSFWGEVNSNTHRALGCVGAIVDGAIRDLDEMTNAGFKALARRLCVGHAYAHPVRWGCPVEAFGTRIEPGQLIHADKHGFLAVSPDEEPDLLEAARFMDALECEHVIAAARGGAGMTAAELLRRINDAGAAFRGAIRERFGAPR